MRKINSYIYRRYILIVLLCIVFSSYSQVTHIDHILIAVDDLEKAKMEYEKYGFNVRDGGIDKKSLNAIIFLKDGTLIELIGKDRFPGYYTVLNKIRVSRLLGLMKDRISQFPKAPTILFNYCLYSTDLDSTYLKLKANKIKCDKPIQLQRKRDDGVIIQWQLIGTYPYDLPFFINDYSPSRLSDTSFQNHPIGVQGIDSLEVMTNSFDSYMQIYNLIYGGSPAATGVMGTRIVRYQLKDQIVILRENNTLFLTFNPGEKSIPVRVYLNSGGEKAGRRKQINQFLEIQ